jgi:hypothetical protein
MDENMEQYNPPHDPKPQKAPQRTAIGIHLRPLLP